MSVCRATTSFAARSSTFDWEWMIYSYTTKSSLTDTSDRGRHLSYQRGKRNTNPGTRYIAKAMIYIIGGRTVANIVSSLIKIEGVEDPQAAG